MAKEPPLSAFYSYSQEDEKLRAQLDAGLAALKHDGWIKTWYDQEIRPGDNWDGEIQKQLHQSDIILALNSNNFNQSKYCMREVQVALERHRNGEARLIPIILTQSMMIKALGELQALPRGLKPLASGNKVNLKLLLEVSQRIREDIGTICANGNGHGPERARAVLDPSQTVLAYLCNRVEQEAQLRDAWKRHFESLERRRRPFLCLVHGSPQEDHAGFLQRLTRYSLPQVLGLGSGSEIRTFVKMKWPDFPVDQAPSTSLMLNSMSTELKCSPTLAEIAPKLYQYGLASVVYCELSSDAPSYGNRDALKSFFDFWAEWPDLPPRQKLVVVLSVQYRVGFPARFPKLEEDIVTDADQGGRISARILDELPAVSIQHVKEWIRRPEVDDFCDVVPNAARWEAEIDDAFRGRDQIPMEQLVGSLNRMLSEYQRR